jgi:hypothetical protein
VVFADPLTKMRCKGESQTLYLLIKVLWIRILHGLIILGINRELNIILVAGVPRSRGEVLYTIASVLCQRKLLGSYSLQMVDK